MEEYQSIGKRIALLRKQQGLTQDQLAERVGVSAQAVSKWENDNSCPDISVLPKVAEVLGVSTDELLGVKPIEPHVVVVDGGRTAKEKDDDRNGFTFHWNMGDKSGIWFGVLVILLGVAFLLSRTSLWPFGNINFWGIVWPAVVLAIGVSWVVKDWSPVGLGVALLGLYYLLYNLGAVQYRLTWGVIWPVGLILLGLTILVDKLVPAEKRRRRHWTVTDADGNEHEPVLAYSDDEGFVHLDGAFTETSQVVDVPEFRGGDVDISFGKAVLDLTHCASFSPSAQLSVDVSFGACEILLPRTVRLTETIDRSFGSSTVKGEPNADAPYQLSVRGDASFGSLTLRYY